MARLFACVIVFSVLLIAAELGAQTSNNGVSVCAETADQGSAQVIANGAGGALVTWQDRRRGNYDIYVQRIDGSGAVQWTANGVKVGGGKGDQQVSSIVVDDAGGAIVAWTDISPKPRSTGNERMKPMRA